MLQMFAGPRRRPQEEYVDWLRRATHAAEGERDKAGIKSWVAAASIRKWMWVGHVARMDTQSTKQYSIKTCQQWRLRKTTTGYSQ